MKHSSQLQPRNDHEQLLWMYDQREWDAGDTRSQWALKYRARLEAALNLVMAATGSTDLVLEVGAGQANCSLLLAEAGRVTCALDREFRALAYARRKHEQGSFMTVTGEAQALPYRDKIFHAVVALELLEHVPDPVQALTEMARVLRANGLLVLTTPNADFKHEHFPRYGQMSQQPRDSSAADADGHYWTFTLGQLISLVTEAGFSIDHAGYVGSVFLADRNPFKQWLTPPQIRRLSLWLNQWLGARYWSYNCFLMARSSKEAGNDH